jgi:hypothetical protein
MKGEKMNKKILLSLALLFAAPAVASDYSGCYTYGVKNGNEFYKKVDKCQRGKNDYSCHAKPKSCTPADEPCYESVRSCKKVGKNAFEVEPLLSNGRAASGRSAPGQ